MALSIGPTCGTYYWVVTRRVAFMVSTHAPPISSSISSSLSREQSSEVFHRHLSIQLTWQVMTRYAPSLSVSLSNVAIPTFEFCSEVHQDG